MQTESAGIGRLLRSFLSVFLPLMALASIGSWSYLHMDRGYRVEQIRNETGSHLRLQVETLRLTFRTLVADLRVLAGLEHLQELLARDDPEAREAVGREFLALVRSKGIYDQVRYLDESGMEIVRVNWNKGTPELVPSEKLQGKGRRYYFRDAFALNAGQVFVSPLDLNVERGEVERPFKPMIRFGTPVFDANGNKRGIVLINYLAEDLLNRFKQAASKVPGVVYLLNRDAFWLASADATEEWGFMLHDRHEKRFDRAHRDDWQTILASQTGQFLSNAGLYTFATLFPLTEGLTSSDGASAAFAPSDELLDRDEYFWKLVSRIPPEHPYIAMLPHRGAFITFFSIMTLLIGGGSLLLVLSRQREAEGLVALNRKIEELEATRGELVQSEKMASLGRLVAGFAHEVNTPVGVAVGAVSHGADALKNLQSLVQQDEVREEDLLEQIEVLEESSSLALTNLHRAASLVQSFKRTSVDQTSEQPRDFRMAELVDDVITSLHSQFRQTAITFDVHCSPDIVVSGIPGIHSQLLTNLIINSLRHGFEDGSLPGTIRIDVNTGDRDQLHIDYADTGVGMASTTLDRVFEPFYTTSRARGGSGLGMYIVYNLVTRQLGGSIEARSSQGHGVTFHIEHPLVRQTSEATLS